MIRCPQCGTEVQPDWDWCHACGWDPEGALPTAALPPPAAHPGVIRSELVPLADDSVAASDPTGAGRAGAASGPGGPTANAGSSGFGPPRNGPTRVREGTGWTGSGYQPTSSKAVPIAIAAGVAVVLVVVAALVLMGGGEPAPVASVTNAGSVTTTTALAVTAWNLPEGGIKVDLPVPLEPAATPELPAPYVEGVAYGATADGRTYLVARLAVHPAYEWEDIGLAMKQAEDLYGTHLGYTVVDRSAGAFKEISSSSFSVVDARRPDETEAAYQARREGPPSGEGIALVTGNHLYLVLVRGTSLSQVQFPQIRDSIVVVS